MAILRSVEATPAERAAYVKHSNAMRRAAGDEGEVEDAAAPDDEEEGGDLAALSPERIAELGAAEKSSSPSPPKASASATLGLRVPPHRTGRAGLLAQDLTKKGGELRGLLPGGPVRPDPAGHRPGPADPHAW